MAAEGAAPSGSRAAGMVGSLWVLALVSSVLALEGKPGGETEEVHLPVETQHMWEVGKIQKRVRHQERKRDGESFREGLPRDNQAPVGQLNESGRKILFPVGLGWA